MTAPNPEGDVVLVPRALADAWTKARRDVQQQRGEGQSIRNSIRAEVDLASFLEAAPAALQPRPAAPFDELREFARYVSSMMHNLPRSATADAVNERALAILAALPPVSGGGLGEPVAWRARMLPDGYWYAIDLDHVEKRRADPQIEGPAPLRPPASRSWKRGWTMTLAHSSAEGGASIPTAPEAAAVLAFTMECPASMCPLVAKDGSPWTGTYAAPCPGHDDLEAGGCPWWSMACSSGGIQHQVEEAAEAEGRAFVLGPNRPRRGLASSRTYECPKASVCRWQEVAEREGRSLCPPRDALARGLDPRVCLF